MTHQTTALRICDSLSATVDGLVVFGAFPKCGFRNLSSHQTIAPAVQSSIYGIQYLQNHRSWYRPPSSLCECFSRQEKQTNTFGHSAISRSVGTLPGLTGEQ